MLHLGSPLKIIGMACLENPNQQLLPLYLSTVQAGFPSPAEDYIDHKLDLNSLVVKHPAATFFVKVEGNSMIDAHIYSGDILVVDRSLEAANGKIVLAIVNGEFTVKRLKKDRSGIYLIPENPDYPLIDVKKVSEFRVWGVVTYVIHKAQ